jgi:DNA-binding MarR family transcriptional regulator
MQTDLDDLEAEARRAIVRALNRAPYDLWTPESLARTLGISSGLTGKLLAELATAGMVRRLAGPGDEYTVVGSDD